MMIDTQILLISNAKMVNYKKGETIFEEGSRPRYYYQILTGSVRMINHKDDGKIFIQGSFEENESFGEPPLFVNQPFPASAVAVIDCEILQLPKERFFKLLDDYPEYYFSIVEKLSWRLYNKSIFNKLLSQSQPETRITAFLKSLKNHNNLDLELCAKIKVNFTRQEIADSVGLRVETVIRALKKMQKSKEIEIRQHKVYI